jgi:hypothetical protein
MRGVGTPTKSRRKQFGFRVKRSFVYGINERDACRALPAAIIESSKTAAAMHQSNQEWKSVFNTADFHEQLDLIHERNVQDGWRLTTVNCWFIGDQESKRMWDEYVGGPEGVAVRSTIRLLRDNIYVPLHL